MSQLADHNTSTVAHHFDDAGQQRDAASLGMWIFLITEVMFFGGLFTAYTIYRLRYPAPFAEASHHLYTWIGAVNTAVLLTSSWSMALAVDGVHRIQRSRSVRLLLVTAGLGTLFVLLKAVEYALDAHDRLVPGSTFRPDWTTDGAKVQLFFVLYFVMTGLHAFHMLVGIGLVLTLVVRLSKPQASAHRLANTVEMAGLYWHLVDIVWIFLFPLLYLL